jgi:hypothetical protein
LEVSLFNFPLLGLILKKFFTSLFPLIFSSGSEGCPTLGFPTPPVIIAAFREGENSFPLRSISSSPTKIVLVPPVQYPSPPGYPTVHIPMEGANLPRNRMDAIVADRYDPLFLPQPMNPLPVGDYLKYMPNFIGEQDTTIEEHLSSFYSYVDNINIENEDVWLRVFVQSLHGEARKWFRGLIPRSIDGI